MDLSLDFNMSQANEFNYEKTYDVVIVGGGPAGMNAALYAQRKGLEVAIVGDRVGGQLLNTNGIDNYLGFQEISGENMMKEFKAHLETLDIPIIDDQKARHIRKENKLIYLTLESGQSVTSRTLIIATGSLPRSLQVPGEAEYAGKGVAYCAICDAPLFKGKDVLIAGGGNSAVEAAIDVAKVANQVTIVHRSQFRADQVLIDQLNRIDNLKIHLQTQIKEVIGNDRMTGVKAFKKEENKEVLIPGDGLFIEIGNIPNTQWLDGLLALNDQEEIKVDQYKRTSVDGIFAAGDVAETPYKQIIIATSDGAVAALAANDYINRTF